MYTQCPDCNTAFRVTANVLRQAAGKVRCGGCGHAFNALDYLSETPPEQPQPRGTDGTLPELEPESSRRNDGLPESISAEQSAALLKTLDQLAGSNIRIEDTGVEWRVLEDDERGDSPVDELLDASPTPVDQFLSDSPGPVDSPEIFEAEANQPASTPVEELRFDDNTPLPEDFDFDVGPAPAAPQPAPEPVPAPPEESLQTDLELADPEEWQELLVEFDDVAGDAGESEVIRVEEYVDEPDEPGEEIIVEAVTEAGEDSVDELLDMDTQFALQAEAMGIDLSGSRDLTPDDGDEPAAAEVSGTDAAGAELGPDDADEDVLSLAEGIDEEINLELDLDGDESPESADDMDTVIALDDDEDTLYVIDDDDEDTLLVVDDEGEDVQAPAVDDSQEDIGYGVDLALDDIGNDESDDTDSPLREEPVILPLTEEEQTINMMIDQDLLSMAVEDKDGFASTIVMPEEDAADMVAGEEAEAAASRGEATGFETIIMEGEFIRSEFDKEKLAADAAAAAALAREADAREAEQAAKANRPNYGLIGGTVLLVLLLIGQILHFSRDALATNPGFNDVVAPVYRAVGKPLTPAWDISGWRFEVTRGSTDESTETLTIYSRLGNKSDEALPYPLIGISLTDRFEETIGSRVLDPADYLGPDLDPRKLVQPGDTFDAVMTIRSPAPEATGFKLNVCYRVADGQLRCAIQDFR